MKWWTIMSINNSDFIKSMSRTRQIILGCIAIAILFILVVTGSKIVNGELLFSDNKLEVENFSQIDYQASDPVNVTIKNGASKNTSLTVKHEGEIQKEVDIQKRNVGKDTVYTLEPSATFVPGNYTVSAIDSDTGAVLSTQDFAWGVLAINTPKSIYLPGESVKVAMAVLNDEGDMVCNADVTLHVVSPQNIDNVYSTRTGNITVNDECELHEVTKKPDYEANFITQDEGKYELRLEAKTPNGTREIRDSFEVRAGVAFDVERQTATRIYPPETYPVDIKITANQDFSGSIVEVVPQDFQISKADDGISSYNRDSDIKSATRTSSEIPKLNLPFNGDYEITSGFGDDVIDPTHAASYKKYDVVKHDGIDFTVKPETQIVAVDDGKVLLAEKDWIYGNSVVVEHGWGRSYYGLLGSINVKPGDIVKASQPIGQANAISVTQATLHFGIKPASPDTTNLYYGKIDPAPYLGIANYDTSASAATSLNGAKALVWDVNLKKGETITIGYRYKAPNTSPNFYTLGALQFIGQSQGSGDNTFDAPDSQTSNERSIVFSELRRWQIAVDATTLTTFVFASTTEGWSATNVNSCATSTMGYTGADGNAAGSLSIFLSKTGGAIGPCAYYWEWSGTWQSLGVPSGDNVSGVIANYEHKITYNLSGGLWDSGALELRDSGGTLRATIVSALTGQSTSVTSFTIRTGTQQNFTPEASSTSIRLRLNMGFDTSGGGTRDITFLNDNIAVTVTHSTPGSGPTTDQQLRHGAYFSSGSEQAFTF